jgi:hypothetical protein
MSSPSVVVLVDAQKYIFYSNYVIYIVGLIGNMLSILVFTKVKLFRGNRCAFYLITESVASIIILCEFWIPGVFQIIYGTDPVNLSLIWCKIRTTFIQSCRLLIASIVCFEALDQFLSTNHRLYLQQISTLKLARGLIWTSYCLSFLQTIPYIIFYNIVSPSGCSITNQVLIYYYSYFYYLILHGLLPILISSLFSLLAYRNVRHLVRRQIPIERRRLDRQMTAMIFVRVIVFIILLLPYTIFRIYILNANVSPQDTFAYAINQLVLAIVTSLLILIYSVRLFMFALLQSCFL